MNTLETDPVIDSTTPPARRPSRVRWLWTGAAAVTIAGVTGLALVSGMQQTSRVIVEPVPQTPGLAAGPQTQEPGVRLPTPAPPPRELTEASRLELDRIGRVVVGMTLEQASEAAGTPITIDARSDRGRGCAHALAEGGPEGLRFMVVNGQIVRIEVGRGPVATVEGITTGSSVQDVLAAYSGRIRVEPHTYTARTGGQYLIYEPDASSGHLSLLFETDGSRVTTFRSGLFGPVMAPEGCS